MLHYDEWLYKLKPLYKSEPGWWKLRWRPIKNGTWNVAPCLHNPFREWTSRNWGFGIVLWRNDERNGWGRSWKDLNLLVHLGRMGTIDIWIHWDIHCMAEGPCDMKDRRPLDIPGGTK